jgi:hypothetical protein
VLLLYQGVFSMSSLCINFIKATLTLIFLLAFAIMNQLQKPVCTIC